jgi:hypothetical protein
MLALAGVRSREVPRPPEAHDLGSENDNRGGHPR